MELQKQTIDIVKHRDIVNLEVIQHEKVKLVFETKSGDGPIIAELAVPGCEDAQHCSRLSHSILHTDTQSYLSLYVHPEDTDRQFLLVGWLLGFVALLLLLFWMFRIWVKRREYARSSINRHKKPSQRDATPATDDPTCKQDSVSSKGCSPATTDPNATQGHYSPDEESKDLKDKPMKEAEHKIKNGHVQNGKHQPSKRKPPSVDSYLVSSNIMMDKVARAVPWWYYVMTAAVLVMFGVFVFGGAYKPGQSHNAILKVLVPSSTHVRHIRSYSEDPQIEDVSLQAPTSSALVTRLHLLDLSLGCRKNLTNCRTHAMCEASNHQQGIKCRCNRGFYLKDLNCIPCKTSCEDGFYMTKQCSAEEDVVCKPCSQCGGTSYEVAACTSTQDTLCIDVTFPLKQFHSRVTNIEDAISLNVTMSKNVFLERLHKIKKLEMSLYMSTNRQEIQFVWRRESGLEIKVKVSDIYLVPEYVDIDHMDDRLFIAKHDSYPQDVLNSLWSVMKHYCRHPIPDTYDLLVEKAEKQTTRATEMTCDSKDSRRPPCPPEYKDGDKYLYENLEYPCLKDSSDYSNLFKALSNNIICSGNTDLLNTVFRQSVSNTKKLRFPSARCKQYEDQCQRCLEQNACNFGANTTDCCNIHCQSGAACKNYYSNNCPPAPVECIKGDITKFSILPRYPTITDQFICHLKYYPPKHLFLLSYEASIPSKDFTFKWRNKAIKYKNISDHYQGKNTVDYLIMRHYADSKYSDEVILAGIFNKSSTAVPKTVKEFTLHKIKESWEFDRSFSQYKVAQDSSNQFRASISFEKPFLYSTRTWRQGGCHKNVTQIVPSQPNYQLFGIVVDPDKSVKDGKFVYQLMSVNSVPQIRFAVPENASILSHYQDQFSSAKFKPGTLAGNIIWDRQRGYWNISLSGRITACPGIFTIELFSENFNTRLALYDMLITCPQDFNIFFNLQRNNVEFSDVFIAVCNDTVSSYRLVLSSIQGPSFFHSTSDTMAAEKVQRTSPLVPILVIIVLCISVSIMLLCVYWYCDKRMVKNIPIDITVPKPDLGPEITLLQNIDQPKKKEGMTWQAKCIMMTLLVLYVVYACLFTFTILFCLLHVIQGSNMHDITLVSDTSEKIQEHLKSRLQHVVEYENNETQRLLLKTQQRLNACNNYLKVILNNSIPDINTEMLKQLNIIFPENGAVDDMMKLYFTKRQEFYENKMTKFVKDFNKTLETNLHKLHTTYTAYLRNVAQNDWFSFPRDMFTDQLQQERPWAASLSIPENLANFLTWIEIEKVQEVTEIREILMKKLLVMLPKLDFLKLLNCSDKARTPQILANITDSEFQFKFESGLPPGYHGHKMYQLNANPYGTPYPDTLNKSDNSGRMIASIRGIIYPLFISVFVLLDILLLMYRFSWLKRSIQVFKTGIEQPVPYDDITRKIHFILSGRDVKRPEDSLDHPYDYYMSNKEDIWGENTELYFLYCQASQKSKQEILRDLWIHKQKQKPKAEGKEEERKTCKDIYGLPIFKFVYRLFISPVFGRLVLLCGFVLLVCLFARAIDDLVTMESAVFLMDTNSMTPILERQSLITNNVIAAYGDYLNEFLASFKQVLDSEVQTLNTMLVNVAESQSMLLNTLISDMCNLAQMEKCGEAISLVTTSLSSCNFLPLQVKPYTGFHENILADFVKAELYPLVLNLRSILFSTLYLLLTFAAAMIICQILARVIFVHLRKSRHMKTIKLFQLPATDTFEQQSFHEKEMYDGHSVIAESCESGVYDLTS